jgi:hypothetical protein
LGVLVGSLSRLPSNIGGLFTDPRLSVDNQQTEEGNNHIDRREDTHYPFTVSQNRWVTFFLGLLCWGGTCLCAWWAGTLWINGKRFFLWLPIILVGMLLWIIGTPLVLLTY